MTIATNMMMMENIVYLRYKVATRLSVYPTTNGNGIGENPSFIFCLQQSVPTDPNQLC